MRAEGTEFVCGVNAGMDVPAAALRAGHDAIVLAAGATVPRGLPMPGAGLGGIHQAMDYLPLANRAATSSILNGGAGDRAGAAGAPGGEDPPAGPGGAARNRAGIPGAAPGAAGPRGAARGPPARRG